MGGASGPLCLHLAGIAMRIRALKSVIGLVSAMVLVACGGGGGSSTTPAPAPGTSDQISNPDPGGTAPNSYTIKGSITTAESTTLDRDTNDPQQLGYASNDTPALAQTITNPTLVVGHMGKKGEGPTGPNYTNGDTEDFFKVNLQAGQVIELVSFPCRQYYRCWSLGWLQQIRMYSCH
jgi:hypothetical protein